MLGINNKMSVVDALPREQNVNFPAYLFIALITLAALAALMIPTQPTFPWVVLITESAILSILLSSCRPAMLIIFVVVSFAIALQSASIYQSGEMISTLAIANTGEYHALGNASLGVLLMVFIASFLYNSVLLVIARKIYLRQKLKLFLIIPYLALIYLNLTPVSSLTMNLNAAYREYSFLPKRNLDPRAAQYMKDTYWTDGDTMGISLKGKNIIVIFTEGLSSQIIDSNNKLGLNLTENIDELARESVVIENYFNHTAATYRGLRGQMTSFYQYRDAALPDPNFGLQQNMTLSDVDKEFNGRLVSLPLALRRGGYNSYFLSSTSTDSKLNRMLANMAFNKVYGMGDFYENDKRMSDSQTFGALRELTKTLSSKNEAFFLGVYPSGTHLGMESYDLTYGDGSNQILNQFYNFDQQLGSFIKWFDGSPFAKNTVLILTADHATFPGPQYKDSFESNANTFVDRIPFMIYGDGIRQQVIDANNFNSLSFAPTILHLLEIKNGFNFFIGCSIFSSRCDSMYSHLSAIGEDIIDTSSGTPVIIFDPSALEGVRVMYDVGG